MENMFTENTDVTTNEVDEQSLPVVDEKSDNMFTVDGVNEEVKPVKKSNGGLLLAIGVAGGIGLAVLGKKLVNKVAAVVANKKAQKATEQETESDETVVDADVVDEAAMANDKKKTKRK